MSFPQSRCAPCVPEAGTQAIGLHIAMTVFYGVGGAIEGRK